MKFGFVALAVIFSITSCSETTAQSKETTQKVAQNTEMSMSIEGMTCAMGCARAIEVELNNLEGVQNAIVNFDDENATLSYNTALTSETKIVDFVNNYRNGTFKAKATTKNCDYNCKKDCCKNKKSCCDSKKKSCSEADKAKCEKDKKACSAEQKAKCTAEKKSCQGKDKAKCADKSKCDKDKKSCSDAEKAKCESEKSSCCPSKAKKCDKSSKTSCSSSKELKKDCGDDCTKPCCAK